MVLHRRGHDRAILLNFRWRRPLLILRTESLDVRCAVGIKELFATLPPSSLHFWRCDYMRFPPAATIQGW